MVGPLVLVGLTVLLLAALVVLVTALVLPLEVLVVLVVLVTALVLPLEVLLPELSLTPLPVRWASPFRLLLATLMPPAQLLPVLPTDVPRLPTGWDNSPSASSAIQPSRLRQSGRAC